MKKVEIICTTDDPIDNLEHHKSLSYQKTGFKMFPAFRPDKCMAVEDVPSFNKYVDNLGLASNIEIITFQHFIDAIKSRHDHFAHNGCTISDHGLDTFYAVEYTLKDVESIFYRLRRGSVLTSLEGSQFKSAMLYIFATLDFDKGWVQQFHMGALRNNSNRLQKLLGFDCGADSIGDFSIALAMSRFFNRMDSEGRLAKTIIYNLNPADNELFASMAGNFQDGSVAGKIQYGSGWWFLDQKNGIEKNLESVSNMGLLSNFIGMLTDSRSFLSFPRHEYFRRILCNMLGNDIENGELPNDLNWIGQMVENICYYNAKKYFSFIVNPFDTISLKK